MFYLAGQAGLIVVTIYFALRQSQIDQGSKKVESIYRTNYTRILTNLVEAMSLIGKLNINWPSIVFNVMILTCESISFLSGNFFSIECFLENLSGDSGTSNVFFIKLIFIFLIPHVAALIIILVCTIYHYYYHTGSRDVENLKFLIITSILVMVVTLQANLIRFCLLLFSCQYLYRLDTPLYYMTKDYSIECWQGELLKWALDLAFPILSYGQY